MDTEQVKELLPNYNDAKEYWSKIEPSVEGMLGGYGKLDALESASSSRFINEYLLNGSLGKKDTVVCDCGAGIGRVTRSFLLKHFEHVDLVEQTDKFLIQARKDFDAEGLGERITTINIGLQDYTPISGRYSMIWCQWVLSQLGDDDLIAFLARCKASGTPFIGIKENVSTTPGNIKHFDPEDSSCTRPDLLWKEIFSKAGLTLIKEQKQQAFPENLYDVKMYMLK